MPTPGFAFLEGYTGDTLTWSAVLKVVMKKVPSYLKGLAETRERVAADVLRYQRILDEVGASLADAQAELAACDRLIKKFDARLDPSLIQPIRAWKGRYGERGALRNAVIQYLEDHAPAIISTTELNWSMVKAFKLDLDLRHELARWTTNTLRSCLKRMAAFGEIEWLEPELAEGTFHGGWRWKQQGAQTLGDLAAMAAAAGVGVQEAEGEVDA